MPGRGLRVAGQHGLELVRARRDPLGPLGGLPVLQLAGTKFERRAEHIGRGSASGIREANQCLLNIHKGADRSGLRT